MHIDDTLDGVLGERLHDVRGRKRIADVEPRVDRERRAAPGERSRPIVVEIVVVELGTRRIERELECSRRGVTVRAA